MPETTPNPTTADAQNAVADPQQGVTLPGPRELDKLRADRYGDQPGSVRIAPQAEGGGVELVFVDGDGHETGREPYQPKQRALPPEGATTPELRRDAGLVPADPGPDERWAQPPESTTASSTATAPAPATRVVAPAAAAKVATPPAPKAAEKAK